MPSCHCVHAPMPTQLILRQAKAAAAAPTPVLAALVGEASACQNVHVKGVGLRRRECSRPCLFDESCHPPPEASRCSTATVMLWVTSRFGPRTDRGFRVKCAEEFQAARVPTARLAAHCSVLTQNRPLRDDHCLLPRGPQVHPAAWPGPLLALRRLLPDPGRPDPGVSCAALLALCAAEQHIALSRTLRLAQWH